MRLGRPHFSSHRGEPSLRSPKSDRLLAHLGLSADIVKVTDYGEIAAHGVMSTPALMVNGKLVSAGKVLSAAEIEPLLRQ